jgi:hypothetical protein
MSQYRATKEAVESLLAQLNSQSKLLCRDAKILKFCKKTEFKKQKIMLPKNRNLRSIDWYQKTYLVRLFLYIYKTEVNYWTCILKATKGLANI